MSSKYSFEDFKALLDEMPQVEIKPLTDTVAHIFDRDDRENFISDWMAFLLDPDRVGTDEPLQKLVELAVGSDVNLPHDRPPVEIRREYTFQNGKRIDFLITAGETLIAIENKIWSDLGTDQLKEYDTQLKKKEPWKDKKQRVQILLCPKNNKNYEKWRRQELFGFKVVTYEKLVEAWKGITFDYNHSRAAFHMQDFITHMEEYIMNQDHRVHFEWLSFSAQKRDEIQKLNEQLESCKKNFSDFIKAKMIAIQPEERNWVTAHGVRNNPYYFQLYKKGWDQYTVHFELLSVNNKGREDDTTKRVFPPQYFQVVLHTDENSNIKDSALYKMGQAATPDLKKEYGKDYFEVSYQDEEAFDASIQKIMKALGYLITAYTDRVDTAIREWETSKKSSENHE